MFYQVNGISEDSENDSNMLKPVGQIDHMFWSDFVCVCAKSLQSHLTLCDPMDCSLPGSSVHGILQARILEWVAVPSSGGIS